MWLNGLQNEKESPNENYGREMMELFTLGADRGAYTEQDVREQARALTGWENRWRSGVGAYDFHFDAARHDTGIKTRLRQDAGTSTGAMRVDLCISHQLHPSFFVQKLWGYFVPTPPDRGTQASLEAIYTQRLPGEAGGRGDPQSSHALRRAERMMKPPIVHTAGLLRRLGMGITTTDWAWIGDLCGQQLFYPPNVAGWDDTRWLDTATFRGRWYAVPADAARPHARPARSAEGAERRQAARRPRAELLERPAAVGGDVLRARDRSPKRALGDAGNATGSSSSTPCSFENALRQLVAMSPDLQTA